MKVGSDKVNAVVQALGNVPAAGVKNNYNGVDISDNGQLRQRFANGRERYLNALISNLNDRFPADDLDLWSHLIFSSTQQGILMPQLKFSSMVSINFRPSVTITKMRLTETGPKQPFCFSSI